MAFLRGGGGGGGASKAEEAPRRNHGINIYIHKQHPLLKKLYL